MSNQRVEALLHRVLANQNNILEGLHKIMIDLTALTAAVTANTNTEASAVTLIQGIAAQLTSVSTQLAAAIAANDAAGQAAAQTAIDSLTSQLSASAGALASAVTANTPAAAPTAPAAG